MSNKILLRSLKQSIDKPVKAVVHGKIPAWINGSLYRNGPGRYEFGDKAYHHLFDGQACVHKFKIENGNVFYSNRLLETLSYTKTVNENRLFPNFGTSDTKSTVLERFKALFQSLEHADNVNVNVVPHAYENLYALTETNLICKLDPSDLRILNTINISKHLDQVKSTIAHPHVENDGSWITVGMSVKKFKPCYEFIRFKSVKEGHLGNHGEIIASVPSTHKNGFGYFHAFGITENYIVFMEQALKLCLKTVISAVIKNKPISTALIMEKDFPTRIHIINKHTGEVIRKKFITDPQFTFHYINSYENENGEIILDLSSYDPAYFDINSFTYDKYKSGDKNPILDSNIRPTGKRVKIPLNDKRSGDEEIYCEMKDLNSELLFELPVINYWRFNGKKYKYAYGANHYKSPFSIVKINVDNPNDFLEMKYFQEGVNFLPSEPIFVESLNPKSEDDGVILVMVLSDNNDFLSVLDAKNLTEIGRAVLPSEVRGAHTFHGFFADKQNFKKLF